jgi:DNA primase large subunit
MLEKQLRLCMPWGTKEEQFRAESWFKVGRSGYTQISSGEVATDRRFPRNPRHLQVPWYTVPDLIASRRVFVNGGNAYVPQSLQISLVLQAFRTKLERALEVRETTWSGLSVQRSRTCTHGQNVFFSSPPNPYLEWTKTTV